MMAQVRHHQSLKLVCMESMIGLGFAVVSIALTIFTAVLVKYFEATHDLPTNLVIIRGILQVLLFAAAVIKGHELILPTTKREKFIVVARGFCTGILFITNVAALRFLPLGDVFTLLTAKSIFYILVPGIVFYLSRVWGKPLDTGKLSLILVAIVGFYLFLCTYDRHTKLFHELHTTMVLPVPKFAFFLEKTLAENTIAIGTVVVITNLALNVPVMYLTKLCDGVVCASVQSFWSGVGGFMVGVVCSFFSSRNSIFSGYYSASEIGVVLFISSSFIVIAIMQSQAAKFISTPALNVLRLVEIPVAYLLCPNEVMPNFYSVMGMLFILSSSVVGDWLLYMEEKREIEYLEIDGESGYEEALSDESIVEILK